METGNVHGTGLESKQTSSRSFGYWTWDLPEEKWEEIQPIISTRIMKLMKARFDLGLGKKSKIMTEEQFKAKRKARLMPSTLQRGQKVKLVSSFTSKGDKKTFREENVDISTVGKSARSENAEVWIVRDRWNSKYVDALYLDSKGYGRIYSSGCSTVSFLSAE